MPNGESHAPDTPYFPFLNALPSLTADTRRRLAEGPLDRKALKSASQKERLAALVRQLNQATDSSPLRFDIQSFAAEGDAGIEALVEVAENDTRLTRDSGYARMWFFVPRPTPVREMVLVPLSHLAGLPLWGRTPAPGDVRRWWETHRHMSLAERWYEQLARPDGNRSEAAYHLLARRGGRPMGVGAPDSPMLGEPVRSRRGPSVSEVLRDEALRCSDPASGARTTRRGRPSL